ncbi:hypothetical protein [Mucilaginibacter terrae]|nr:hypothetical protein [Mucilaginibacter terrae]
MAKSLKKEAEETEEAIEALRNAINGVNGEIPKFSDGLKAGLTAVAEKLPDVVDSMIKLNAQNKELAAAGGKPKSVLSQLAGSMFSWNTIISVGVTLLITYGGQILEWISSLNKGKDAMAQAKARLDALNNAMGSTEYKTAIKDVMQLKIALDGSKKSTADKTAVINLYNDTLGKAMGKLETLEQVENRIKTGSADYIRWTLNKAAANQVLEKGVDDVVNKQKELNNSAFELKKAKTKTTNLQNKYNEVTDVHYKGYVPSGLSSAIADAQGEEQKARDLLKANEKSLNGTINNLIKFSGTFQKTADEIAKKSGIVMSANTFQKDSIEWLRNQITELEKSSKSGIIGSEPFNRLQKLKRQLAQLENYGQKHDRPKLNKDKPTGPTEEEIRKESADRMALLTLDGFTREIEETNQHFAKLKKEHQNNNATVEQLEREHQAKLSSITHKFQEEGLAKLAAYSKELNQTSNDAHFDAIQQLTAEYRVKADDIRKVQADNEKIVSEAEEESLKLTIAKTDITDKAKLAAIDAKIEGLEKKRIEAQQVVDQAKTIAAQLAGKRDKDSDKLNKDFAAQRNRETLEDNLAGAEASGDWKQQHDIKQQLLNTETQQAIDAANGKEGAIAKIKKDAKDKQDQLDKARMDAEVANQKKYVQGLDKMAGAVGAIFGKNTIAARLAFKAHQAAAAAQVIIDTRQAIMGIWKANAGFPLIGTAKAIAETAIVAATGASNLATIMKQKPGFAQGGQYTSDGRGALLPGYSRTDNTNAYLRSGEAVVVSEAMRNPWARNLVSAINVAYGGRDFSIPNTASGYAIGGVFTDGGNASRYYSQPMNDQKDLANTLAYQMLNNFPPIYVDVKDVNNQQNILAQTVNRVNL